MINLLTKKYVITISLKGIQLLSHFIERHGFIATVFVPTVLEAVLEAARQKMHAIP